MNILAIVPQNHPCDSVMDCIKQALINGGAKPEEIPQLEEATLGIKIKGINEMHLPLLKGIPGIFSWQYAA